MSLYSQGGKLYDRTVQLAIQVQAFYWLVLHLYLTLFHTEPTLLVESATCMSISYSLPPHVSMNI